MQLYIGENIKRLRREKGITQEILAERMHVSCAAVSKWERGETLPDIGMIIPLASYFGVSTDEILGLDAAKNREKIDWYLSESARMRVMGMGKERFSLVCQAYTDFPNDWEIIEQYIEQLAYDPHYLPEQAGDPWGVIIHKEELLHLCQRVLDECPVDKVRYTALDTLVTVYSENDNREKAIETAMRFPEYWHTQGEQLEKCKEDGVEWMAQVRTNLYWLACELFYKMRRVVQYEPSADSAVQLARYQTLLAFFDMIFAEGDYGFFHQEVSHLHFWMGDCCVRLKDSEKAFFHYEKGFYHAREYEILPRVINHTSYFVKNVPFDMAKTNSNTEMNTVSLQMEWFMSRDIYNEVKDHPKMQEILAKYRPFMGNKRDYTKL